MNPQQGDTAVAQRRRAHPVVGIVGSIGLLAIAAGIALAADHAVAMSGQSFSPANLTVSVGDTVTWTNSDAQAHTATADGGSFDTGTISSGQSGTVTFNTAGSFPYHCTIHPQMIGTITVQAIAAAVTPPAGTDTVEPRSADAGPNLGAGVILLVAGAAGLFLALRRMPREG